MTDRRPGPLSSRELLQRIGLYSDTGPDLLLEDEMPVSPDHDLAQALRAQFDRLRHRHTFAPGDLVSWKPGLRNRRFPRYGRPAVVVEVLAQPVLDDAKDSGDAYFREPLDIVLGMFIEKGPQRGDFLTWHVDSRRFQPWQPEEQRV